MGYSSSAMGIMNDDAELKSVTFNAKLEEIATTIRTIAQQHHGESSELLAILRLLECLHREIRDGFFQESLPGNRQALYALLRDIELNGGWPYIHRIKLQALLSNFQLQDVEEPSVPESGKSQESVRNQEFSQE